ncbi:MAG TPA: OsmC family protein [Polyangiales bacterium]|nr:OsmC family protein [Polyangiales bacterium]
MRTGSSSNTHGVQAGHEDPSSVRDRYERRVAELRDHPEHGHRHGSARAELAYGFACDVDLGDRSLRVDLPRADGGSSTGPHPGQLMRASLSACLVMGYRAWAARLDVPLDDVAVQICCAYDERGQLGIDDEAWIGWQRIHWTTTLWSSAPDSDLTRLVETTHRFSPMLANLAPYIAREFELRVVRTARSSV